MRVVWSERAAAQAREIFAYIARDRPTVAERILEGFLQRADLLAEFPEQGKPLASVERTDLRSVLHESYRIVYRVRPDEVAILSVRHTRMGLEDELPAP